MPPPYTTEKTEYIYTVPASSVYTYYIIIYQGLKRVEDLYDVSILARKNSKLSLYIPSTQDNATRRLALLLLRKTVLHGCMFVCNILVIRVQGLNTAMIAACVRSWVRDRSRWILFFSSDPPCPLTAFGRPCSDLVRRLVPRGLPLKGLQRRPSERRLPSIPGSWSVCA